MSVTVEQARASERVVINFSPKQVDRYLQAPRSAAGALGSGRTSDLDAIVVP